MTTRRRSAAVVLAVTLQRLLDNPGRNWSAEEVLVLAALRRSTSQLANADEAEIAKYLAGLDVHQLRGVVSNVKGIYHEMLVKAAENADGDGEFAEMPGKTNQPGYDLEFLVDGEVVREVQLKAVSSPHHIYEHLARYPGIDVLATEEIAALMPGISGSGFHNAELEAEVRNAFQAVRGETVSQEMIEAAGASVFVTAAFAARRALRAGRVDQRELQAAMGDVGVGLTTAIALDVLLGGGV